MDVVIVSYGNSADLESLVPGLVAHPSVADVIVIDHGSDGAGALAEQFGARVLIDESNPGFGAGQNRGRALANAPFILVLNPDLSIRLDSIAGSIERFTDESVAAIQGVIMSATDGQPERSAGEALRPVHLWGRALGAGHLRRIPRIDWVARQIGLGDHVDRAPDRTIEVEALAATATLFRRSAMDAVDGFDERIFLYGEDMDLCVRLRSRGWKLLALPEVWAIHENGKSSPNEWSREVAWWQGTLSFAALHWTSAAWALGTAAAAVRMSALAVRRPLRSVELVRRVVVEPHRLRRGERSVRPVDPEFMEHRREAGFGRRE